MTKKSSLMLFLILLLSTPISAQSSNPWQVGYDSTILSQGATAKLSLGNVGIHGSLHYSLSSVIVAALMNDTEAVRSISQLVLLTGGVTMSRELGRAKTVLIGPKVYALSHGLQRWVVSSLGLDVSYEIWNEAGDRALVLGAFIPVVLCGEMVLSGNGGISWAWDEFGFAVSPSVGYLWRL